MADHKLFQRREDDLLTEEIEDEKRVAGKKKAKKKSAKKMAKRAKKKARKKR